MLYAWFGSLATRGQPLTFRRLAPVVATSVLVSGLLTGLYHPLAGERTDFRPTSDAAVFSNGNYARVAESAEFIYVVACDGARRTVAYQCPTSHRSIWTALLDLARF